MLTLAEAAKEPGLTKPVIFKAIKNGDYSIFAGFYAGLRGACSVL